jgi:hypothetical protein
METKAKDKNVKIRIISRKGNTREETRRELMEMSEEDIKNIFESYCLRLRPAPDTPAVDVEMNYSR